MAIHQFHVDLIPTEHLLKYFGNIPKILIDDDQAIDGLFEGIVLPEDYESILDGLGTKHKLSWTDALNWGDYDRGSHITIWNPGAETVSVSGRLSVSDWDNDFAVCFLKLAEACGCHILTKTNVVIEPILDDLIEEVKRSNSYRFCVNPRAYLLSDEVARLNEDIKNSLKDV